MHRRHYEWQGQPLDFTLQSHGGGWQLTLPNGSFMEILEARVEGSFLWIRTAEALWRIPFLITSDEVQLLWKGYLYRFRRPNPTGASSHAHAEGTLMAPMPGLITRVFVQEGQSVAAGERLLVLEAMKTEQSLRAPFDGVVTQLNAREGEIVQEGTILVEVSPALQAEEAQNA